MTKVLPPSTKKLILVIFLSLIINIHTQLHLSPPLDYAKKTWRILHSTSTTNEVSIWVISVFLLCCPFSLLKFGSHDNTHGAIVFDNLVQFSRNCNFKSQGNKV